MKKKVIMASAFALTLIACLLLRSGPITILGVYASGTPDAYGDRINWIYIEQYYDGAWHFKGNITYSNYTSGIQVKVDALMQTRFNCSVHLNSTYASSTTEAITNTRVYINITYTNGTTIISTTEMTDFKANDAYNVQSYYLWDDATHFPQAGVTYYVYFKYQAYY